MIASDVRSALGIGGDSAIAKRCPVAGSARYSRHSLLLHPAKRKTWQPTATKVLCIAEATPLMDGARTHLQRGREGGIGDADA